MTTTKKNARIADVIRTIAGPNAPANTTYAETLGPDYICATDDGSIIAWGPERAGGYRDLDIIPPKDQS